MTCKEKLKELHPDWDKDELDRAVGEECPVDNMDIWIPRDEDGHFWCSQNRCEECWDREFPDEEHNDDAYAPREEQNFTVDEECFCIKEENAEKENNMVTTKKTKAELMVELENAKTAKEELEKELKNLEKYKKYEDMAGEFHAVYMSFVTAGFSEERAYDILKTAMMAQIRKGF